MREMNRMMGRESSDPVQIPDRGIRIQRKLLDTFDYCQGANSSMGSHLEVVTEDEGKADSS